MAYQGGISGPRPVSKISQLSTAFPAEKRVKIIGPRGSFTAGRIGTAVGKADGDHVLFRDHRLDRHSDVGECSCKPPNARLIPSLPRPMPGVSG